MLGTLAALPAIRERLGGKASDWRIREVGDGNLNLVFIVEGEAGAVVVKQALPYVRLVGDSWPLPLERSWFEYSALTEQAGEDGPVFLTDAEPCPHVQKLILTFPDEV